VLTAVIDNAKFQLRREPDGSGVLLINSMASLFLDRTATLYLESYLARSGKGSLTTKLLGLDRAIAYDACRRYKVSFSQALRDWTALKDKVWGVARGDICPFSEGGIERIDPFSRELLAPYRVDLALTYRCNNDCSHCYAGGSRQTLELTTEQWVSIIKRLHQWQVPQLVFTGGESLLRPDLEELVCYAEELGLLTGLITNGRLLTKDRCASLRQAGLDYVQITLESHDPEVHDKMVGTAAFTETVEGIKNALASGIYTTTNLTITTANEGQVLETIRFLKKLGVRKCGINAVIKAGRGSDTAGVELTKLKPLLQEAQQLTHTLGMEFIWFTPTCYCDLNPVQMGLGVKTCSAARTVLAIEPDGNVMPCQSYFESLGNAVTNDFNKIWAHPLAIKLRNREIVHPKCHKCEKFSLCGSGCPLDKGCQ